MDDFKISVPTGITVITFDNTMLYDTVPMKGFILHFFTFCYVALLNCNKLLPHINIHPTHHNDKAKTEFYRNIRPP